MDDNSVPIGSLVLSASDSEERRITQRKENKKIKQQKRRLRQRETEREMTTLADVTESQASSKAEPKRKKPSPLKRNLKFAIDLHDSDNPQIDWTVAEALSEKDWDRIVRESSNSKALE